MLKIFCAGCLGLSPAISAQFTLEIRVAAQNRKKSLKPLILGFEGHLRSSMLTFLRSWLPVLVMISSMFVPICNQFHVRRANSGRMTSFRRSAPLSPPRSWGPLSLSGMKFCHEILETLSYHTVKTRSLYLNWS